MFFHRYNPHPASMQFRHRHIQKQNTYGILTLITAIVNETEHVREQDVFPYTESRHHQSYGVFIT
jgi:hypothetical protein